MAGELRRAAIVGLGLAVLVGSGSLRGQRITDAALDISGFDRAIREELVKGGTPGAAVAVVIGDEVVWAKGFGLANVETAAPVTPDTLFQIGSVTKTFTAAALLSASTQGVVALDRPVSTYVNGLTPCVGAPSLAQLLSHTGGLIDEPDQFGPQGEDGLGAYQRTWTSEYCMLSPGRAFSYSNSGYALAGLALQEAEKKPFADVMRSRVLDPLGMTRTTFRPTEAMTWPLAVGHRRDKEGRVTVVRPLANDARLWPAGTLYSSANEMARFVVALMNDGQVENKPALPVGIVGRMRAAVVGIPTTSQEYGLGMFVSRGRVEFGHGGTMTGYAAQMSIEDGRSFAHPDSRGTPLGVVVLTNGDGVSPSRLVDAAMQLAHAELTRRTGAGTVTVADGGPIPERRLSAAETERLVGSYRNPRRFGVEVVRDREALVLKRFGREFPMRALETPGHFVVDFRRGGTEIIAFGLPANGPADYLQMNVWAPARVTP